MDGFTKLHARLVTSTIWRSPDHVRIAWITMLALSTRHGEVYASIPGLAAIANVSIEHCEDALRVLMAPDSYSRTKDNQGRRIVEIDGGWRILNHDKYRELASRESRTEQNRQAQQRHRERKRRESAPVSTQSAEVSGVIEVSKNKQVADAESESGDPLLDQNPSAAVVALTRASACNSSSHISRETEPDLGEDESRFGPEPYAGLSSRGVAAIWLRITGLAHVTQRALTAFADMARVAEQAAGAGQARQAVLVGVAWIVHGPDGPVRTKRVRLNGLTPWLVAERFANDLEAANAWWHDGGREYWQKLSTPPKAAEASQ